MWMYGWIASCVAAGMLTALVPGSVYRSIEKKLKHKRYQEIKWFRRLYLKRSMEQRKRSGDFQLSTLRVAGMTLSAWENIWTWFAGMALLPGIVSFIGERLEIERLMEETWEYLLLAGIIGVFFVVLGVYRGNWTERRTNLDRTVKETLDQMCAQEAGDRSQRVSQNVEEVNHRNVEKMETRSVREAGIRSIETGREGESRQEELVGELFQYFFETPADEM